MTTPEMPSTPTPENPVPPDVRSIDDMPFAGDDKTRETLKRCGVTKAFEIEGLGCTGAVASGLTIAEITELRIGLGGGGVGLPCFVKSHRFCLAHNTIGGLQEGQAALYPGSVAVISRALTPEEAGHVAYAEAVRRTGKGSVGEQMAAAAGALSGYGEPPRGAEMVEDGGDLHDTVMRNREAARGGVTDPRSLLAPSSFICPEHMETNWSCRFCVAQAITGGELEPTYYVFQPEEGARAQSGDGSSISGVSGPEMLAEVESRDAAGAKEIEVYVLVATYKRKLSR